MILNEVLYQAYYEQFGVLELWEYCIVILPQILKGLIGVYAKVPFRELSEAK